jgi:hypothetical protein
MPTSDPSVDYVVPRGVGVTQVAYEMLRKPVTRHFTTKELLDDITSHGIRIVKLWLEGNPFDGRPKWGWETPWGVWMSGMGNGKVLFEDMDEVWRHPDVDIFVVRFVNMAWTVIETGCSGWTGPTFAQEPSFKIAKKLLKHYGNEDKTIIFSNWEGDNQWRGSGCNEPDQAMWSAAGTWYNTGCRDDNTIEECAEMFCRERMAYVKRCTERRQEGIEQARALYPDATLRIFHSLVVSDFDEKPGYFGLNLTKDMIPTLEHPPDFIGVSYYTKHEKSITEIAEYIAQHTGYPPERLYIDEIGAPEKIPGRQYDRLMAVIPEAFVAGYAFACIWMWKQTWHDFFTNGKPKNFGMWQWTTDSGKVEWGEPTSGLQAIQEINDGL